MAAVSSTVSCGAWSSKFSGWWQATCWPGFSSTSGGSTVVQICVAFQHLSLIHIGGEIGEGTSPLSRIRSLLAFLRRGSGIGTADMSALVYGCIGAL